MSKKGKSIVVSDGSLNDKNCRLFTDGGDPTNFLKNPVMLYMHNRGEIVGRWENLRKENGQWLADPVFDTGTELGKKLAGQWERGFLNAASVTAIPIEWVRNEQLDCYDLIKWEFFEISLVDIGSNKNAVRLTANGVDFFTDKVSLSAHLTTFSLNTKLIMDQQMLALCAVALGLAATAKPEEVKDKVIELAAADKTDWKGKYEELQKTVNLQLSARGNTLVDAAVKDGRITADEKPTFLELYASNPDATEKILLNRKPAQTVPSLVALAANGGAQAAPVAQSVDVNNRASLAAEWDRLQRADGEPLVSLKAQSPDYYKVLFKAKYGVSPE